MTSLCTQYNIRIIFSAVVEPWLRAYIQKFKGKSIKTDEWKEFLYSYFSTEEQVGACVYI